MQGELLLYVALLREHFSGCVNSNHACLKLFTLTNMSAAIGLQWHGCCRIAKSFHTFLK